MTLLESYIFRRVFRMFLVALVPVLAIIWTTQVLSRINLVTDSGQSIGSFAMLATFILPTIIPVVLPFALIIGATQTLQTMNNDSEFAVIDGAGAARKTIYKPVLLVASLLCVASFTIDNFVEPVSRLGMRKTIAATYADLLSSVIEEKAFRKIDDGLYVQISERLKGRVMRGLFVADSRDPRFEMLYYAREGAVDEGGGTLIMKDGEIHRKALDSSVSIIHFDSYSFDLSELSETRGQAKLRATDRDLAFLFNPNPKDPDYMEKPQEYRAELHRRLTDWFFPVTFALISLAIAGSAHSHRERTIHPLIPALGVAFAVRWGAFFLANRIEASASAIVWLYVFVIGLNLLLIAGIVRNSRHLGKRSLIADFSEWLVGRIRQLAPRKEDLQQ
ncbi:LptF/LptG family permease [Rhizobium sp. KVB221]|uniref:LptF/LptG family permease n=1 Tax=Rhizobium setariae TaxID=2801340 RepID=A0A937CJL8_9HYPH|nr:LptF/LptG family permease [Rhizobium setariae]MBL0371240.1 LptF/LptG family permease [Rhizobium setariae]